MSTDLAIPLRFPLAWAQNAGGSYVRPIPTLDPGLSNGDASLDQGFPPITFEPIGSGGIPPWGADMNGILQEVTQWLLWVQAGGPIGYDATFSGDHGGYPLGATLAVAGAPGQVWISTVDGNTTDPDTGGAGWVLQSVGATYFVDSGTANHIIISPTAQPRAVVAGMRYQIKVNVTNTGAVDLKVGSLSAVSLVDQSGAAMTAGMLVAGYVIDVMAISGSAFQWIAAPPAISYINAAPAITPVAGNMLVPVWDATSSTNRSVSMADIAEYIGQQGLLLPFFMGNFGGSL